MCFSEVNGKSLFPQVIENLFGNHNDSNIEWIHKPIKTELV